MHKSKHDSPHYISYGAEMHIPSLLMLKRQGNAMERLFRAEQPTIKKVGDKFYFDSIPFHEAVAQPCANIDPPGLHKEMYSSREPFQISLQYRRFN